MIMLGLIARLVYILLISGHFAFSCLNVGNEVTLFINLKEICPENSHAVCLVYVGLMSHRMLIFHCLAVFEILFEFVLC